MGKYHKSMVIELPVGTREVNLPTQAGIGNGLISGLYVRSVGKASGEYNLPTVAVMACLLLNLRDQNGILLMEKMPLAIIERHNAANGLAYPVEWRLIDWGSSTIEILDAANTPAKTAVELTFCFEK